MRVIKLLLISGILAVSVACEKKEPVKNNEAKLLGITLISGNAVIDTANKKVLFKVPESVDLTKIVPHFEISVNATIYPPSDVATNYSSPVVYTITSEDKTRKFIFTVSASKQIAQLTVYDCSNWSAAVPGVAQAGAVIKIFIKADDVNTSRTFDVLTTDQYGKADFFGEKGVSYLVTISKDNKSNIINGYVLDGRYDSQAEINSSPVDPNAVIGGLKFKDVNGDWRVWPDDKYNYDMIGIPTNYSGVKPIELYIAGTK